MTLKSKYTIKFKDELITIINPDGQIPFAYIEKECSWEYNTKKEKIQIISRPINTENISPEEEEFDTDITSFTKEEALRALELLMNWAETCNGIGTVEKILKKN